MNDVDDPWRWWSQVPEQTGDRALDVSRSAVQELACTVLLKTFQGADASAEDEPVDCLLELVLQFLELCFLLRPSVDVGGDVLGKDVLVILEERLDCLTCQLESDLRL